ncbi:MAG TPA: hypothetical protein VHA14_08540 [Bryobacteraceae bacterium]|nr:hypothetical protein [Bryobacteraceae bacterium]
MIVTREALNSTSAAELFSWTVDLEKQGCIPLNSGFRLAENIIDSLPLDFPKRAQLLGRGYMRSVNALRVISTIYKAGGSTDAGVITGITQKEGSYNLNVDLADSHSSTGYEIDWYDFVPVADGFGYRMVLRSAEIHVNGNNRVDHPVTPSTFPLHFSSSARWYGLFMMTKASPNDSDFVVVSAASSAELQSDVAQFQGDSATFLREADPASYAVLPHGSGINAYVRVKENGTPVDLLRGSTVWTALSLASGADPHTLLPRLKLRKLHDGKLFGVEWDRKTDQILSLPLDGGEEIDW